jgi:hypothetical protein
MPGRRINRTQVAKYMEHRKELEQETAAAKVGISVRSARRIERAGGLPSKREARQWRTRADPLSRWWASDTVPLLESTPALNAVTILEELQRRYLAEVSPGLLRTLQRRLRQWRAVHGSECEVYFAQEHPPGRLGLSDFTDGAELGVVAEGRPLAHRPLSIRFGVFGLAPRRSRAQWGELRGAGERAAERAVAIGWSAAGASDRLAVGGVSQLERRGGP